MKTLKPTKMAKAKATLVLDHPFFASLLLGMPMTEDSSIPTFATDGNSIRFNPDCADKLELNELVFVLAHEVMHCVFQHMTRRGARNPNKWNIAGDYVINDVLIKERVGRMPSGELQGLNDPKLVAQGNGTTEGVYNLLPPDSENKGAGQAGGALDSVSDAAPDQAGQAAKESEMRVKIVQARNAAKMAGKLSQGMARLVSDLVKPRVDWKSVLRRFLTTRAKTDLSYSRPKRRFLADDLFLPSLTGEKMGKIAIGVDCSGSINDQALALFSAEIQAISEDIRPESIEVIYFDSEVISKEVFTSEDSIVLKPLGGGGTAFSPVFECLKDSEIVACVILTDLECHDFGPAPSFPVLWASTNSDQAPFGEVTLIKGEL